MAVPCLAHRVSTRAGTVGETAVQALVESVASPR
jgi:hypothetical protein